MAKISPLILILVVMGLIAIHLSQVTSSISTSNQENISHQDVQKLQREHQLGGTKEGINFLVRDQPDYTIFYENTPSIGIAKSRAIEFTTNDEDHSNVELDKLNDGVRYEILPTESVLNANLIRETDSNNIVRLLSKLISYNRQANDLVRNQIERKRSIRRLAFPKEDKDYSFVLQPLSPMNKYNLAGQRTTKSPRWATQKLRDMILANAKSYRYSTNDQTSDQLSQARFNDLKINKDIDDIIPETREKRRRCKIDPNLGVKNPSFCDTDAYFGAADYSMRDVWDSAGRR